MNLFTADECHAWFHLHGASEVMRNTTQAKITPKNLVHRRIQTLTRHSINVTSQPSKSLGHCRLLLMIKLNVNVLPVIRYIHKLEHNIVLDKHSMFCSSSFSVIQQASVLFCRLMNVDIILLFLTIFICYMTEMNGNGHIVDLIYTGGRKKSIFCLSKRRIYYKSKFCLDTSNLYPLIQTIKFLNNFCWWRIPLAMTSLTRIGVYRKYVKEIRARKQFTFEENGSLNNFPP